MYPIDLGSPKIRSHKKPVDRYIYRAKKYFFLPTPTKLPRLQFFKTILQRKSRREFFELNTQELANILWFTCKTLSISQEKNDVWEHRCTPSAGGIHPIDILISMPKNRETRLFLYDPTSHSLRLLSGFSKKGLNALLMETNEILPVGQGVVFWFVAQFHKTLSKYQNGESLVWRDSGALTTTMYLVSEALGLSCCAIGATGNPYVSRIFGGTEKLKGVGGCLIGARR